MKLKKKDLKRLKDAYKTYHSKKAKKKDRKKSS